MAQVKSQKEDKIKKVKENTPNANSVPQLRDEVARLGEIVENQDIQIERLMNQMTKK